MSESIPIPLEERGIVESQRFRPAWLSVTALTLAAGTTREESLITTMNLRNALPEPYDISDHVANVMWTVGITGILLGQVKETVAKHRQTVDTSNGTHYYIDSRGNYRRTNTKLFGTAIIAAAGLNALSEVGLSDNGDMTDVAYGMAGGLLAYLTQKPKYINPLSAADIASSLPADNQVKTLYFGVHSEPDIPPKIKNPIHKPQNSHRNHHTKKRRR